MSEQNAVVAIYESHAQAEEALKELQKSGFDMKKLSIVGKDYHTEEHVVGYYNAGDRMKRWGKTGAFWGGFWGLLFGTAFFAIPGIGPVLVAGQGRSTVQRLNLTLLIDTQNQSAVRRRQIQADDVPHLVDEERVLG